MLNNMPDFVFYPIITMWSIIYGALAGAFFKLLAVYENWITINRLQLLLWKKYPQRSYRKYINALWASQIRGKPVEMAEYTREQLVKAHPKEPFPLAKLLINTLFMLLIAPFMALQGVFEGPVYVFRRATAVRLNRQIVSK